MTTPSGTCMWQPPQTWPCTAATALLAAGDQAVIMAEDLRRDFGAEIRHDTLQVRASVLAEFK